jgi:sec-independent protein translocase protein TatC
MALVPFPSQNRDDEQQNLPEKGGFSPFGDHDEEPGEGRMTFLEHLDELRKRITHSVVALLAGFIISFAFYDRIRTFIYLQLTADIPGGKFIFTEPTEAFFLLMKMCALTGVLIASPYIMWQVWLFIAPGLYAKEKKFAIPFVLSSSLLFIAGAAFSHYVVFPAAWAFFASFSNQFIEFMPRIDPVFGLYVRLIIALGLTFQMPVLIFVLSKLGIVTAGWLIKNFKYAVLVMVVAAAVITPDGNPITQLLVAGPMVVLYLLGVAAAWLFGKSKKSDRDSEQHVTP